MKTLIKVIMIAAMLFATSVEANCRYVWIDGKSVWMCTYGHSDSKCRYVYLDGTAVYMCNQR